MGVGNSAEDKIAQFSAADPNLIPRMRYSPQE